MNAKNINQRLYAHFFNYNYKLFNSFIYGWESDFFAISKTGYSIEVEIKVSKSDFKADFKKKNAAGVDKHHIILSKYEENKPNKFYFACPEGLIKKEDINPKYGLIWVYNTRVEIVQNPKFLHKAKMLEKDTYLLILLNKFYHRNIELRHAQEKLDYDIEYGQRRLFEYNYF